MTDPNSSPTLPPESAPPESASLADAPAREVAVDWEALENAFENNAPEVHSYLQTITGDVIRVVDGVADPLMHTRIAADPRYLRVEAVSSREQYRWMERYIPTVEEPKLRARLEVSIDGKGAFRRFKDVLMAFGSERERWFTYRSERLRIFMEAWLAAHSIKAIPRTEWAAASVEVETEVPATPDEERPISAAPLAESNDVRRGRNIESLRKRLRDHADAFGPRDLESVVAFADFLKARRTARSFAHHHGYYPRRDDLPNDGATDEPRSENDPEMHDDHAPDHGDAEEPSGHET